MFKLGISSGTSFSSNSSSNLSSRNTSPSSSNANITASLPDESNYRDEGQEEDKYDQDEEHLNLNEEKYDLIKQEFIGLTFPNVLKSQNLIAEDEEFDVIGLWSVKLNSQPNHVNKHHITKYSFPHNQNTSNYQFRNFNDWRSHLIYYKQIKGYKNVPHFYCKNENLNQAPYNSNNHNHNNNNKQTEQVQKQDQHMGPIITTNLLTFDRCNQSDHSFKSNSTAVQTALNNELIHKASLNAIRNQHNITQTQSLISTNLGPSELCVTNNKTNQWAIQFSNNLKNLSSLLSLNPIGNNINVNQNNLCLNNNATTNNKYLTGPIPHRTNIDFKMDRRACDPYSSPGTRQLSYNKGLRAAGGSVLRITPKLEKHYQFQFTPALINNIISTTGSIANNNNNPISNTSPSSLPTNSPSLTTAIVSKSTDENHSYYTITSFESANKDNKIISSGNNNSNNNKENNDKKKVIAFYHRINESDLVKNQTNVDQSNKTGDTQKNENYRVSKFSLKSTHINGNNSGPQHINQPSLTTFMVNNLQSKMKSKRHNTLSNVASNRLNSQHHQIIYSPHAETKTQDTDLSSKIVGKNEADKLDEASSNRQNANSMLNSSNIPNPTTRFVNLLSQNVKYEVAN